ncbi:MAG: hypothetical protein HND48_07435 [Chloroflexi bacterium]|nr:hypothetical protein [Chloroflexota bacterium]
MRALRWIIGLGLLAVLAAAAAFVLVVIVSGRSPRRHGAFADRANHAGRTRR